MKILLTFNVDFYNLVVFSYQEKRQLNIYDNSVSFFFNKSMSDENLNKDICEVKR